MINSTQAPLLVFDGGCPFCRHFAELSELRGGIPDLRIRDGRADGALRQRLNDGGWALRDGAVLLVDDQVLHGAAAIQWLCARMSPSAALLRLLNVPLERIIMEKTVAAKTVAVPWVQVR